MFSCAILKEVKNESNLIWYLQTAVFISAYYISD